MSEHRAHLRWQRQTPDFDLKSYNREHTWTFPKSGQVISASSAPAYRGKLECVDPEEAFVASLASCHMLTFLALAARRGLVVDSYADEAVGLLAKNTEGRLAITHVTLRPSVQFSGTAPDEATLRELHDAAHHDCFLAASVKCEMTVESAQPAGA